MNERALVLGGGGATGNAWEIGVIAGLFAGGVDVTNADLVIGTSAGATVAVQVCSALSPPELLANILDAPVGRGGATGGPVNGPPAAAEGGRAPGMSVANHMETTSRIIAAAQSAAEMRRELGAAALQLAASSGDALGAQAQRRATVAARLPVQDWPQRRLLITAVDAHSGDPVVFDRDSGVELADAVTASTANGFTVPAHAVGERRYIDGGYRSNADNADLAAGYRRVLVLSPFAGRSRSPARWGMDLAGQVEGLRSGGSRVEIVLPGSTAAHLFGANAMDLSLRRAAAQIGHEQGEELVRRLSQFWS